jgi:hypothetical protein
MFDVDVEVAFRQTHQIFKSFNVERGLFGQNGFVNVKYQTISFQHPNANPYTVT